MSRHPRHGVLQRAAGWAFSRAYNWHWVDARVARCAQAYWWHVGLLLDHNAVRTVINLRGENPTSAWYIDERAACARRGVSYVDLALHSRRLPPATMLLTILAAIEAADPPVVLKCSGGADRTGLAAGLYLLDRDGGVAGLPAARRQLQRLPYLHFPQRHQRWMRPFLDFFAETHGGRTIRNWLENYYTPEALAMYLRTRGQGGSWRS